MNNQPIFIVLRRMRLPLLVLIITYAVALLGLVLMPGVNAQGQPEHLSFFHAFYIVTYTATTTGFGEIPHPFTDAQRAWITFAMYFTIIAWLYAIGALIALVREPAFVRTFVESRFRAAIKRIHEPFYIVCGYGDTGAIVVDALLEGRFFAVIIDQDENRISELALKDLPSPVLALASDATLPDTLLLAGLTHPWCAGVIALNKDDDTNLKIAISAKLLNPHSHVICRASSHDTQANMESFNTDVVINPFDSFAERLGMALHSPDSHLIYEWLTAAPTEPLARRIDPPRGTWLLCGYGRFGQALARTMKKEGISPVIIEEFPERVNAPQDTIRGRGTEAVTLQEAHIGRAVGIVAGTQDDANNLSIVVTANMLKPDIFMVARQNQRENDALFDAAQLDIVMQRSRTIARRIMALVRTPLLNVFLIHLREKSNDWAAQLVLRLHPLLERHSPDVWSFEIDHQSARAVNTALINGATITGQQLLSNPHDRNDSLPAMILLIKRGDQDILLPDGNTELHIDDRVLCVGRRGVSHTVDLNLNHQLVLDYLLTGETRGSSAIWRWMTQNKNRK